MLLNDLQWYTVGDARILKIQDLMLAALSPEQLLPDWDEATALQIYPRLPETLDSSETKVLLSIHSWLIEDRGRKILIDTGAGNNKARPAALYFDHLQTVWLENLMRAGVCPEDIDFVLLTHLHVDHVGWNIRARRHERAQLRQAGLHGIDNAHQIGPRLGAHHQGERRFAVKEGGRVHVLHAVGHGGHITQPDRASAFVSAGFSPVWTRARILMASSRARSAVHGLPCWPIV